MIVSLLPSGVRCQVGDFVMLVLFSEAFSAVASAKAGAKDGRLPKANLILKMSTDLPIGFPLSPEVVAGAGEYEMSGVRVKGISLDKGASSQLLRTVYAVELEGVHLSFLGEIGEEPIDEVLDRLGRVDILFLAGSGGKIKQIMSLIKQVDPKLVIPLNDKTAKILAEELGQKVEAEEKLVIKKKDLDKEETAHKLVWLKS